MFAYLFTDTPGKWRDKEEHFIELPPEICQLKIIGFSKDIGSSLSLLPSIMHRLESTLVAIELKEKLVASFPEGAEVTADRVRLYLPRDHAVIFCLWFCFLQQHAHLTC